MKPPVNSRDSITIYSRFQWRFRQSIYYVLPLEKTSRLRNFFQKIKSERKRIREKKKKYMNEQNSISV